MIRIFILLLCSPLIASQRIIPESEVREKLSFYQKIKELKTQFHQVKSIKSLGMELKSEGEMVLTRPEDVIWKIKKPSYSEVRLHSNTITLFSGEGGDLKKQEMTLGKETDPNVSKALLSMMAWMRMDIPEILRSYTISEISPAIFRCEPKSLENSVFAALVFKLHPKGHVNELTIEEKSGDSIKIEFETPTVKFSP